MFNQLRVQMTLLYLLAALLLTALVGGSAYYLVDRYFQSSTDLALQHRMVEEMLALNSPVPAALHAANQAWFDSRAPSLAVARTAEQQASRAHRDHDDSEIKDDMIADEAFDAMLATIVVWHLSADGQIVSTPNTGTPPFSPNQDSLSAAMAGISDLRTVTLADGQRARVLTYRLQSQQAEVAIQVGRLISEQDRVLHQLLLGLLALAGACALLMSLGSWLLAGRAIRPAQEAWARQQTFVANASHELRAPLTLLRASAEVALRGTPPERADDRELLGDVLQECDHMSLLVEDLLLLSRLDSGRLTLVHERIALADFLADTARQIGRLAEERKITLDVSPSSGAIWGDPPRMRQVLLILLDNALRHTPAGGTITLAAQEHGGSCQISVADTGCGIAPEHLPHVFERFYRASSDRGESGSGSGLGLSIAHTLLEVQSGHITIESQLGQGTRVLISMPSARA